MNPTNQPPQPPSVGQTKPPSTSALPTAVAETAPVSESEQNTPPRFLHSIAWTPFVLSVLILAYLIFAIIGGLAAGSGFAGLGLIFVPATLIPAVLLFQYAKAFIAGRHWARIVAMFIYLAIGVGVIYTGVNQFNQYQAAMREIHINKIESIDNALLAIRISMGIGFAVCAFVLCFCSLFLMTLIQKRTKDYFSQ